jgi:hypothetical protein
MADRGKDAVLPDSQLRERGLKARKWQAFLAGWSYKRLGYPRREAHLAHEKYFEFGGVESDHFLERGS